jgi:sigma-B regulation protein RsbU (phosphoserine phosphatase)
VSTATAREAFYAALLDDDAESLYEQAPCGYLSTTPDGLIVKVNQTFLTMTGYARDELVRRRYFAELLTAGGRIYHETHYAPLLQMQGRAREIALDIVKADAGRLAVLVNSVLERDATGSPVVVRTAIFDATDRREYERELLRAKERAEASEAHATALARTLQATLIPPAPPHVPGLDIAAVYRPAGSGEEVGGDFYDVFEIGQGDWVVVLGDVCGKGVDAAVVTALARYTVRAASVRSAQPSQVLETLNQVLLRHETDRFCTVVLLRLREENGSWTGTVGCGGHPLPLLTRAGGQPEPWGAAGSLVGVLDTPEFRDTTTVLRPGDSVVLYTDGVTEARSREGFFGDAGLAASVARHAGAATALVDGLLREVLQFQSGNARDDIAVVAVAVPPAPRV